MTQHLLLPSAVFPTPVGVFPDILLPDYLYSCMMWLHQSKGWEALATGTLSLVNIKVSDVRTIELSPR